MWQAIKGGLIKVGDQVTWEDEDDYPPELIGDHNYTVTKIDDDTIYTNWISWCRLDGADNYFWKWVEQID